VAGHLLAFAVGLLLAWALLVLPAQRRLRAATAGADRRPVAAGPDPAPAPVVAPAPPPPAPVEEARTEQLPAVDPALSTLDRRAGTGGIGAAGVAALGAVVAGRRAGTGTDPDTARIPVVRPAADRPPVVPGAFPGSARPLPDGAAPAPAYTIKGNARSMLYHTPASPYYSRTTAEVWFTSAADAEAAGFADIRSRRR
jgi:hypothetical protein